MDDAVLLARLRQGDDGAFAEIFRELYPALVAAADRLLADRAAAEDVAQDAMLELWRRRETLPPDTRCRAYLYQAARNRALNRLRHLRTVRQGERHAPVPSASDPADAAAACTELDAAVRQAVAALPGDVGETFHLSRTGGLTYGEIAQVMGVSVKTVEARMGRALRALRTALAQWLPPGGGW